MRLRMNNFRLFRQTNTRVCVVCELSSKCERNQFFSEWICIQFYLLFNHFNESDGSWNGKKCTNCVHQVQKFIATQICFPKKLWQKWLRLWPLHRCGKFADNESSSENEFSVCLRMPILFSAFLCECLWPGQKYRHSIISPAPWKRERKKSWNRQQHRE